MVPNLPTFSVKMKNMSNELIVWLNDELQERGWSIREMARRAALSHSTISNILSGGSPTFDVCAAIARATGVSPVSLFRKAGLLPSTTEEKESRETMLHWFDQLSDEDQERAIVLLRSLADLRYQKLKEEREREEREREAARRRRAGWETSGT